MSRLLDWLDGVDLGWPHVTLDEFRRRLAFRRDAFTLLLLLVGLAACTLMWWGLNR